MRVRVCFYFLIWYWKIFGCIKLFIEIFIEVFFWNIVYLILVIFFSKVMVEFLKEWKVGFLLSL